MKINFTAPLKPIKIPDRLIYSNGSRFNMADTRTGSYLGKMKITPMQLINNPFYKNKEPVKSLYINDLWIMPFARRNNAGAEFVKFAKYLSKKNNCEGRVYTLAYNYDNPGSPPHKFCRKMGFATTSKEENRILDEAIKNDTPIPADMCMGTTMFLEKY